MDRISDRVSTLDPAEGLVDGHVTAYGGAIPAPEPEQLTAGAGGVVTTATDLARWIAMQQRDGRGPDGTALLSPALVNESRTPQPGAGRHGFGWFRSAPDRAPARISTSGTVATFSAQQDLVPETGYGVVVLLNSFTPLIEHGYELSGGIVDVTAGADPDPGVPTATIVDLVLGGLTLLVLALGVRGVLRAGRGPIVAPAGRAGAGPSGCCRS